MWSDIYMYMYVHDVHALQTQLILYRNVYMYNYVY